MNIVSVKQFWDTKRFQEFEKRTPAHYFNTTKRPTLKLGGQRNGKLLCPFAVIFNIKNKKSFRLPMQKHILQHHKLKITTNFHNFKRKFEQASDIFKFKKCAKSLTLANPRIVTL